MGEEGTLITPHSGPDPLGPRRASVGYPGRRAGDRERMGEVRRGGGERERERERAREREKPWTGELM